MTSQGYILIFFCYINRNALVENRWHCNVRRVVCGMLDHVMWPLRFASLGTCRAAGHAAACLALCFSLPPTYPLPPRVVLLL